MIDDKMLAEEERKEKMLADNYANKPEMVVMFETRIEIIRLARRYLALRESGVIVDLKPDAYWLFAGKLDAAADRLLEDGE